MAAEESIVIIGAADELGLETSRQLVARGHRVVGVVTTTKEAQLVTATGATPMQADPLSPTDLRAVIAAASPTVVLNVAPQVANSLLHDGHKWKGFDVPLRDGATALVAATQGLAAPFLIHTSYAFLYGNCLGATESDPVSSPGNTPAFTAAIAAERTISDSGLPFALARLGYLYGPHSRDLKLYKQSFDLHRAYYAGPANHLASMLHINDAAAALVLLVEARPNATTFNIADELPVAFGTFIDTFAHDLGYKHAPPHIPPRAVRLAAFIIKPPQVALLNLRTSVDRTAIHQQLGWIPTYPTFREGLLQVASALFPDRHPAL